jgi:hypothetical protein
MGIFPLIKKKKFPCLMHSFLNQRENIVLFQEERVPVLRQKSSVFKKKESL